MEADGEAWQFDAAHALDSENRQDLLLAAADSRSEAEASLVLDLEPNRRQLPHPETAASASSPYRSRPAQGICS